MKTLRMIFLAGVLALSGCKKDGDTTTVTPASTKPDYQLATEAKYKALGWAQGADNGGTPQPTAAKKGWVQYYGSKDRAIYYFNGAAFSVLNSEMKKFDALGQDNFAYISSDAKSAGSNTYYNEIIKVADNSAGIIITTPSVGPFALAGAIYMEYLRLNRWDGALGFPLNDEAVLTTRKEGRWNAFQKGQIYWSAATGAHAFWGKVETMYRTAGVGYDGSWLGLPTSSCDPNVAELKQLIRFQNGVINAAACGSYQNSVGETVYKDAARAANVSNIPCY